MNHRCGTISGHVRCEPGDDRARFGIVFVCVLFEVNTYWIVPEKNGDNLIEKLFVCS